MKELFDIPLTVEEERGEFAFHLLDEEYLRRTWSEHRAALLASWVEKHPGTRPQAWWLYDAVDLPRLRLGGVGTPECEVFNVATSYWLGIPRSWVSAWDVAYYTGTATDVDGQVINPKAADDPEPFRGVAIDPADPPIYEAQATYLRRRGLLLRGEEGRLTPADFEPEKVVE